MKSFLWYDLETFGTDPCYDRIAQFACRRTDEDLNPIGDPVVLYNRISADYLPDPGACLVTGITPQTVKAKGIPECYFIEKINNIMKVPYTCTCGFNSIKFDDEFIRNTLYRNLMDPYSREYNEGRNRWDIIDLARAAHDFRPEGINWPNPADNGHPVFKLTELTKANNIDQTGAHDAMVDVDATISIAKLIKEKQPNLFNYALKLRNKTMIKNLLNYEKYPKMLLHTDAGYTNENGCSTLIVPITPVAGQENRIICFNLKEDPAPLLTSDDKEIFQVHGLVYLAINKCPFVSTAKILDQAGYKRLNIDYKVCEQHYNTIVENIRKIIPKLRQTNIENKKETPSDPDFQIYSGFFSENDKNLFSTVRSLLPQQILSTSLKFSDPRCSTMVRRYVCRNFPELLTTEQVKQWKQFSISRLSSPPGDQINNIKTYHKLILEKLQSPAYSQRDKDILKQLLDYEESLKNYLNFPESALET